LSCYQFFSHYNKSRMNKTKEEDKTEEEKEDSAFDLKEQMKIFLQKDEEIFERYGDEEAELYNKMVELDKIEQEQRRKEQLEKRE